MAKDKRPMLIKRGDTTFEKIKAYFINPDLYPLSDKTRDIYERYNEIFKLRVSYWSTQQIVNKLVEEKGICLAQAYLDVRNSENLFGNVLKADAEGSRALWIEWTRDLLKRARQNNDRKSETAALKLLAEYGGFSGEDNADFNPEKLENVEIKFAIPKELYKYLKLPDNQGVDDSNLSAPIDIEFEEIEEDDAEQSED